MKILRIAPAVALLSTTLFSASALAQLPDSYSITSGLGPGGPSIGTTISQGNSLELDYVDPNTPLTKWLYDGKDEYSRLGGIVTQKLVFRFMPGDPEEGEDDWWDYDIIETDFWGNETSIESGSIVK